jgi:hypothetical protein
MNLGYAAEAQSFCASTGKMLLTFARGLRGLALLVGILVLQSQVRSCRAVRGQDNARIVGQTLFGTLLIDVSK